MKKLLLLIVIINYTVAFSQETYYSDVNLELSGTDLKDALAAKIISTHINLLNYTPDVWEASKITDKDTDPKRVVFIYCWGVGYYKNVTNY
jgi:hypothetical protein